MPLTTLNKVINLLIIGAFAMALTALHVALFMPSLVPEWLVHPKNWTPGVVAALVPVAVVVSVVVETFAFFLRTQLHSWWEAENVSEHWLAYDKDSYWQMETWRDVFEAIAAASPTSPVVAPATGRSEPDREYRRRKRQVIAGFAVASVFRHDTSVTIDWIIQHYAMFRLEMSTVVVLGFWGLVSACDGLITGIFCNPAPFAVKAWIAFLELVVAFAVFVRALEERAYVYEVVYRHAFLLLREAASPQRDGTVVISKAEPAHEIASAPNADAQ